MKGSRGVVQARKIPKVNSKDHEVLESPNRDLKFTLRVRALQTATGPEACGGSPSTLTPHHACPLLRNWKEKYFHIKMKQT